MIELDGRTGEGGGQILRTSLALSAITGQAIRITHIRGRRGKPGLLRQHLTAARAAAEVCGAEVNGATLKSGELTFIPSEVRGGSYTFDIGSAGSANLVLQTILPILMTVDEPSTLCISGGTHNPSSPNSDFLKQVFASALSRFGPRLEITIKRHGFYPAGGGTLIAHLTPRSLRPAHFVARERLGALKLEGRYAQTTRHKLEQLAELLSAHLSESPLSFDCREVESLGPGWVMMAQVDASPQSQLFTAFEQRGVSLSEVAQGLAQEIQAFVNSDASVDEHLADQLLLPMALAGGGSFVTTDLSLHTTTNMEVISRFLSVNFEVTQRSGGTLKVRLDADE